MLLHEKLIKILLLNFSHGGDTAALFAKNHLMNFIVDQSGFWSNDDEGKTKSMHKKKNNLDILQYD